jgi:putative exosortase-associated protein (TIGR04073 family)
MHKAGRGLAAVTTGFLEVPGNMVMETERNGPVYGTTLGFVKGLGGFVVREVVGVYELLTAPIEEPDDYQPLIEPEYPWGYFDEHHEVVADTRFPRVAEGL